MIRRGGSHPRLPITPSGGKQVKLFIVPDCPLCLEARQILDQAGVRYAAIPVPRDPPDVIAAKKKSGINPIPVPQLMIGPHIIGSLDRIKELHVQGNLRRVLDQS